MAPYFSLETPRKNQLNASLLRSSYLQVFLGALTPDEMKKREKEREKIKVGRLKTTNTQIEVRVVCLRRVCLRAVCSRASLTGVSLFFVSHHLDRIAESFLVRNFSKESKTATVCPSVTSLSFLFNASSTTSSSSTSLSSSTH